MTRTTRLAALSLLAVAAVAGGVAAARAEEGGDRPARRGAGDGVSRLERRLGRALLRRRAARREDRREGRAERREDRVTRLMEMPEDRAREALAASEPAAALREETRAQAAAILVGAWRESAGATAEERAAIRTRAREALKALKSGTAPRFAEIGRPLVDSMADGRRAEVEKRLEERGRTFDPDRAAARLGRRLGSPLARALLAERLGR